MDPLVKFEDILGIVRDIQDGAVIPGIAEKDLDAAKSVERGRHVTADVISFCHIRDHVDETVSHGGWKRRGHALMHGGKIALHENNTLELRSPANAWFSQRDDDLGKIGALEAGLQTMSKDNRAPTLLDARDRYIRESSK